MVTASFGVVETAARAMAVSSAAVVSVPAADANTTVVLVEIMAVNSVLVTAGAVNMVTTLFLAFVLECEGESPVKPFVGLLLDFGAVPVTTQPTPCMAPCEACSARSPSPGAPSSLLSVPSPLRVARAAVAYLPTLLLLPLLSVWIHCVMHPTLIFCSTLIP